MSEWTMHPGGETAVGAPVPVVADGDLFATLSLIWSDVDGVRVSLDWARDIHAGTTALEDLSAAQAGALADRQTVHFSWEWSGPPSGRT